MRVDDEPREGLGLARPDVGNSVDLHQTVRAIASKAQTAAAGGMDTTPGEGRQHRIALRERNGFPSKYEGTSHQTRLHLPGSVATGRGPRPAGEFAQICSVVIA